MKSFAYTSLRFVMSVNIAKSSCTEVTHLWLSQQGIQGSVPYTLTDTVLSSFFIFAYVIGERCFLVTVFIAFLLK